MLSLEKQDVFVSNYVNMVTVVTEEMCNPFRLLARVHNPQNNGQYSSQNHKYYQKLL